MRRFLIRSATSTIAEGVVFTNGAVATSMVQFADCADRVQLWADLDEAVMAVPGHVNWVDQPPTPTPRGELAEPAAATAEPAPAGPTPDPAPWVDEPLPGLPGPDAGPLTHTGPSPDAA